MKQQKKKAKKYMNKVKVKTRRLKMMCLFVKLKVYNQEDRDGRHGMRTWLSFFSHDLILMHYSIVDDQL